MEKRTRKEAKWSLRNRAVQFTNGAAQGGARTCRSATDSVHCSLWWKDKFTQYRVFRNCGSSEKRSTTIRWSMSFSWCRGFVPPSTKKKKAWLSPPERLVKSQIACVVIIVFFELRLGRKPRSASPHPHYLLFSLTLPAFFHHISPCP